MDLIIDTFRMSDPDDELYNQNDIWLEDFINERKENLKLLELSDCGQVLMK